MSANDFSRSALDPTVQLAAADAAVAVDEMKLVLSRNFAVLMEKTAAGAPLDIGERVHYRHQAAQVVDRCCTLISRMFYACGAWGVYRTGPLARIFADIHTARTHVANNPDRIGRNYGGTLLGEPNTDLFL